MPASRSSRLSGLVLALALALSACRGCDEAPLAAPIDAAASSIEARTKAPPNALSTMLVGRAREALGHARAFAASLGEGLGDRSAYLAMRRAIAGGAALFRLRTQLGAEALLGPERSANEAAGSLARLDAALTAGDRVLASRQIDDAILALMLIEAEAERNGGSMESAGKALSSAAYDFGALALESAGAPSEPDAVLADLRGTLDSIALGLAAMLALCSPAEEVGAAKGDADRVIASLRAPIDAAATSLDLRDRASLVRNAGALGAHLRRVARGCGAPPNLPYPARAPLFENRLEEPISALTLPAPRRVRASSKALDDPALAALGRALFRDVRLSKGQTRSCATCHDPARAFTDGLARAASLDPNDAPLRNTPTLLYTSLHAAQMADGRTLTAGDQALTVIHSSAEMGLEEGAIEAALAGDAALKSAFDEAMGGLTASNVALAIVAFEVRDLVPADAPIDRFARGDDAALDDDASRGLDVFAGPGRCSRCHVPPFFGGSLPRDFAVPVYSVIGAPSAPKSGRIDPDPGRGAVTKRDADAHAFKTPTVRNVARTAPYFHHGAFATLEDVVDFYDVGGGRGLGLDVPNQDPDVRPLKLSAEQKKHLLAFLREALTDRSRPFVDSATP